MTIAKGLKYAFFIMQAGIFIYPCTVEDNNKGFLLERSNLVEEGIILFGDLRNLR
jgi:hypothetical protein